jgi:putative endonuclease
LLVHWGPPQSAADGTKRRDLWTEPLRFLAAMIMYYVYVVKSTSSGSIYIGSTNNIKRRLIEHNCGNSRYTKNRGPWELIYVEEKKSSVDATKREKFFKTGDGRKVLKNILRK